VLQGIQGHLLVLSVVAIFAHAWCVCHGDGSRQVSQRVNDASRGSTTQDLPCQHLLNLFG